MITQSDPWRSAPRIARDHFAAIIRDHGNSGLTDERDPGEYWDYIVSRGVDPLYILSQFNHESNLGINGTAVLTRSWGNTRAPNFGATPVATVPGRSGTFPAWASWMDGLVSTVERYLEPSWYYHDRPDIGSIFINGGPVWAPAGDLNDPAGYLRSVLDFMNANADQQPAPPIPGGNMPRIIVHAGHVNIGDITADKIGQAAADNLRHATGANGEAAWNGQTAMELCRLLTAAGADAVLADACYDDSYATDADAVVAIHYDGGAGTGHPQYCMASTVHSGPSTEAADALADVIVQEWYASYPQALHIAGNGPITVDMQQYYGGWYRTADTPMLLIEHCLGADANGIRADRPTPEAAAAGDFTVLAKHFGLSGHAPPPAPDNKVNGHVLAGGFRALWESNPDRMRAYGFPDSEEYDGTLTTSTGVLPVTVQDFQRVQFIYDVSTPDPFRVRVPLRSEKIRKVKP